MKRKLLMLVLVTVFSAQAMECNYDHDPIAIGICERVYKRQNSIVACYHTKKMTIHVVKDITTGKFDTSFSHEPERQHVREYSAVVSHLKRRIANYELRFNLLTDSNSFECNSAESGEAEGIAYRLNSIVAYHHTRTRTIYVTKDLTTGEFAISIAPSSGSKEQDASENSAIIAAIKHNIAHYKPKDRD